MKPKSVKLLVTIIIIIIIIVTVGVLIYNHNKKRTYAYNNRVISNNYIVGSSGRLVSHKSVSLPNFTNLTNNYYDTDTSLFCAYLIDISYDLRGNVSYDKHAISTKAEIYCPDGACPNRRGTDVIGYWCDNGPTLPWKLNTCNADYKCPDGYGRDGITCFKPDDSKAIQFITSKLQESIPAGSFKVVRVFTYTCGLEFAHLTTYAGFILEISPPGGRPPIVFIVLRGTDTFTGCEWGKDLTANLIAPSWDQNIKVHKGFDEVYQNSGYNVDLPDSVRESLVSYFQNLSQLPSKIIITGHSLGAAVIQLIGADMAINFPQLRNISKIFAFAPPFAGDEKFAQLINSNGVDNYSGLFSIINTSDLVPHAKAPIGYVRPDYQLFCFGGGLTANSHGMGVYEQGVTVSRNKFDAAKNYPPQKHYPGNDLGYLLDLTDRDLPAGSCW